MPGAAGPQRVNSQPAFSKPKSGQFELRKMIRGPRRRALAWGEVGEAMAARGELQITQTASLPTF